jgi:PAS domain S-box-containing protein
MNPENSSYFNNLRHHLLNDALLWMNIAATPGVTISIARVFLLSLPPSLAIIQTTILVSLWLAYFYRKHLSYHTRVFIILASAWLAMAAGLIQLGPIGLAGVFAIISSFIAILYLNGKMATGIIAVNVISLTLIGIAASMNWLQFNIDYQVYSHHPIVWINTVWGLTAYSVIFALIGRRMILGALETESKFHTLYDSTSDAVILLNRDEQFLDCNKATLSMFGCTNKDELRNYHLSHLSPATQEDDSDSAVLARKYIDIALQKGNFRFEWIHQRVSDRQCFPADVQLTAMQLNGNTILQATVRDITERKRIEKMKSEFVSTVSHELRTPLTSISGALGLINGGALGEMPDRAKSMLAVAHRNSLRLIHLINDLLDMDKLIAGKMHFDMKSHELMPLLDATLESVQSYGEQYQVSFVINSRADKAQVIVDDIRLQQVLNNFLSNAAKFSPTGGQVEISVLQLNDKVRVEVIDHGPGIQAEFRTRIFQKFSQADSSDTRQKGGTGLVLAISKEIIDRMNGVIGFDSTEGQGACFYFELPVAQ